MEAIQNQRQCLQTFDLSSLSCWMGRLVGLGIGHYTIRYRTRVYRRKQR